MSTSTSSGVSAATVARWSGTIRLLRLLRWPAAEPPVPRTNSESNLGETRRIRDMCSSSAQLSFEEGDFVHLLVLNRAVPEEAALTEQLAMIGGDGDPRVLRDEVEQFFDDAVEITDGVDLALKQGAELGAIEELLAAGELSPDDLVGQVLEHSVHAADARPLVGLLVRQGERIVRLADVEQVERGLF